jgi:LytR cell envelope-related transcriptional attenuator
VSHVVEIPLPFQPRRLWTVLFVVLGIGALAVVMVGVAVLLTKGHSARHATAAKPAIQLAKGQVGPASPVGKPRLSRAQTTILILNGNGINGAAGAAASVVRHFGYRVRSVGNAPRMDYPHSLVMFRPGLRPEALHFARAVGVKLVGPLDGLRIGAIQRAKLVYVLGR